MQHVFIFSVLHYVDILMSYWELVIVEAKS